MVSAELGTNLGDQIDLYLSHIASPRTRRTYQAGLRVFVKFITENRGQSNMNPGLQGAFSLDSIDTNVLQDFQTWLGQKRYSRFSQRTYLASVNAFLSFALSQDMLPSSFSLEKARAKLKHISRRSSYPIPRPDPALPRLVAYFDNMPLPDGDGERNRRKRLQVLRDRAFVHLLYSSAGRLSEVGALDRKDVADGRRREAIVHGKGDKERFIFITPEARSAIQAYIAERGDSYEPLFISHGRNYGARFTKTSLWRTVSRAAKSLGMDISPHDFRHFRARQMLEQGAPLEAIQEILGHSDIGTTRRVYAHYSKPSIRSIFERTTLPPAEAARLADAAEDLS